MFLTHPQFRQFLPPALYGTNKEGHRAVALSTELPWYLLTFLQTSSQGKIVQSILVAWESTLLEILDAVGPEHHLSLAVTERSTEQSATWCLRQIDELWTPSEEEAGDLGPLLFKFAGAKRLTDLQMRECRQAEGRALVFKRHEV